MRWACVARTCVQCTEYSTYRSPATFCVPRATLRKTCDRPRPRAAWRVRPTTAACTDALAHTVDVIYAIWPWAPVSSVIFHVMVVHGWYIWTKRKSPRNRHRSSCTVVLYYTRTRTDTHRKVATPHIQRSKTQDQEERLASNHDTRRAVPGTVTTRPRPMRSPLDRGQRSDAHRPSSPPRRL